MENLTFKNIRLHNIGYDALLLTTDYAAWGAAKKDATHYPTFRNITFKDISCEGAGRAVSMNGISQQPIKNVTLENVSIQANSGMNFNWIDGLKLINVTSTPKSGKPMSFQNCKNVDRKYDYDPSKQIRFRTPAEADAKRGELIEWIWPDGLPTGTLPAVTSNIDLSVFSGDLAGLDSSLAVSVDRLDANIIPYDYHSKMYLIHPVAENDNNKRLVLLNAGHRSVAAVPFTDGVNDAVNRLLSEGFVVIMTDMPFVGFNTDNTIELPNDGKTVTIGARGSGGHNELFSKLNPPVLDDGEQFRFFLEPFVQGINHFLHTTPDAIDVSFVGISGGGWSGHMIAAVDTRIRQSFPVAGAYPLYAHPRDTAGASLGDAEAELCPAVPRDRHGWRRCLRYCCRCCQLA